jgi:signal transduction histidine kinase
MPARINGLTTDVTERRRFEEEISRAWKSAALADQAKSSFLSAASHDLRQPLQTLRFLQAALEPHLSDGEGRNLVGGIARSLDTMSGILSSLLDVNRLEAGDLRPSKSDFAINDVFDSVAVDVLVSVADKGLRWRMVRSECMVHSDRKMLEVMLRNLLSNAVRYTDRGTVLLGCRRATDKIRIEVWDSGIGVSQDQLPHIFQEYYQARTVPSAAASDWDWLSSDASGRCSSTGSMCAPSPARAPCSRSRFRAGTEAVIRPEPRRRPSCEGQGLRRRHSRR